MDKTDLNLLTEIVENELPVAIRNNSSHLDGTAILIPVLNEEDSILYVLRELTLKGIDKKNIYVIDNKSEDKTVEIAQSFGVNVLECEQRGKGNALRLGFSKVISNRDLVRVITIDGDYTYPADAVIMASMFSEWFHNDVIIMKRSPLRDSMPLPNMVANLIINSWAKVINPAYPSSISDICSGLWCFPMNVLERIYPLIKSEGFTIESEYYCLLNSIGRPMYEFKHEYRPRIGGEKKTKPIDALRIMKFIWDNR